MKRFFIVAPNMDVHFEGGVIGFSIVDGVISKFYKGGESVRITSELEEEVLRDFEWGYIIEVPDAEFVLCI